MHKIVIIIVIYFIYSHVDYRGHNKNRVMLKFSCLIIT